MPDEHDRSGIDVARADRQVIQQAAAELRQGAIRAGYAGLPGQHFAFGLALVLDELALHWRDLRPEVREQTLRGARMLDRVTARPRCAARTVGGVLADRIAAHR